jgi:monovalent cation/hydrogen antiporter
MRGVVSLAAALSIPVMLSDGTQFPFRNLILFITFVVILVTLVLQGLTLPWLIRKLDVNRLDEGPAPEEVERIIQSKLAKYSIQFLQDHPGDALQNAYAGNLMNKLRMDLVSYGAEADEERSQIASLAAYQTIYLGMLEHQRALLTRMNQHAEFDEELIRKYMALIDLEEMRIRERLVTVNPET